VAGMLLEFRITLPDAVANLVTVQQSASAVVEQTLNFDCTAGSRRGLELFFLKQTMAAVLPLVLPLVGVIWLLVDFYKRARGKAAIEYRNDKIVASLVVLFYIAFPAIVGRIAITFACTKYGDNGHEPNTAFLMQKSLSTRCYSYAHLVHIGVVTTPAIIFYMLMIPGYLVYKIRSLRSKHVLFPIDKNYQPCWTYRFGFLFGGKKTHSCRCGARVFRCTTVPPGSSLSSHPSIFYLSTNNTHSHPLLFALIRNRANPLAPTNNLTRTRVTHASVFQGTNRITRIGRLLCSCVRLHLCW
jgi:hypothetical protein